MAFYWVQVQVEKLEVLTLVLESLIIGVTLDSITVAPYQSHASCP
jgi:hypothetical protein